MFKQWGSGGNTGITFWRYNSKTTFPFLKQWWRSIPPDDVNSADEKLNGEHDFPLPLFNRLHPYDQAPFYKDVLNVTENPIPTSAFEAIPEWVLPLVLGEGVCTPVFFNVIFSIVFFYGFGIRTCCCTCVLNTEPCI